MEDRRHADVNLPQIRGRTTAVLRSQPAWVRVGGAGLLALLVFAISVTMRLPQQGYTFLLLYPVVIASAYFAGRDAGIAATATAALCVGGRMLLMWDSANDLLLVQIASLLLFILIGGGSSVLMSRLKRALRELELANEKLLEATDGARAATEETDLLLRELRHRIRNDLTNLVAILRMQAKSTDGEATSQLNGAADRLQVLAAVHERLSRQGHSPIVDMKPFIENLCGELRATLLPLKPVALDVDVEELSLPSTRAVCIGLIVNELVTNAIKYAFPDDREGSICVYLECDGSQVEVGVEDDGIGFTDEGVDVSGLGHRLVRSLAAQLGGRFACQVEGAGMSCTVTFPREAPSGRQQQQAPA